uniref:PRELI/MSF1 domain-containing protein n=1 Tax=Pipistrellus kuhlii TaxID=59472 RepID=A0A7J7RJX4_PIPKU|nr:hypothetical protein mPipKuh1_014058 [Pipistrellus kuhlii]
MTTFTWNINHAQLMVVEERCVYWTEIHREAWVSSSLFGVSRAVQEFVETAKEAMEKAKETTLAATEKAKDLAKKAATKKQQQQQFV